MDKYVAFFFGTPKRFLATILGLVIIWAIFNLDQVVQFLDQLFVVLTNHVLPLVILIAIIIYVLKTALGGKGPAKK